MALAQEDYDWIEEQTDLQAIIDQSTAENEENKQLVLNDIECYINDLSLNEFANLRIACEETFNSLQTDETTVNLMLTLGFEATMDIFLKTLQDRYSKYLQIKETQ